MFPFFVQVTSAVQQYKQQWPSPVQVLRYILREQAFETETTNQELTLRQCLELPSSLPAITAEELAGPEAALMSLEQAQRYLEYYKEDVKNSTKATSDPGNDTTHEEASTHHEHEHEHEHGHDHHDHLLHHHHHQRQQCLSMAETNPVSLEQPCNSELAELHAEVAELSQKLSQVLSVVRSFDNFHSGGTHIPTEPR